MKPVPNFITKHNCSDTTCRLGSLWSAPITSHMPRTFLYFFWTRRIVMVVDEVDKLIFLFNSINQSINQYIYNAPWYRGACYSADYAVLSLWWFVFDWYRSAARQRRCQTLTTTRRRSHSNNSPSTSQWWALVAHSDAIYVPTVNVPAYLHVQTSRPSVF